LAIH